MTDYDYWKLQSSPFETHPFSGEIGRVVSFDYQTRYSKNRIYGRISDIDDYTVTIDGISYDVVNISAIEKER